jgi:hypothetical protein
MRGDGHPRFELYTHYCEPDWPVVRTNAFGETDSVSNEGGRKSTFVVSSERVKG